VAEALEQRFRRQEPQPRGSELERKRQAIEALADCRDVRFGLRRELERALTVCARSTKSTIAGESSSGASAYSRSAEIRSGVLLVVTTRSPGQRSIRRAISGTADATICSRLSRSRSALLSPISTAMPSSSVRPSASFTSSSSARVGTNCAGSVTSASATNATPSRNS
jgi:hypothetical protein